MRHKLLVFLYVNLLLLSGCSHLKLLPGFHYVPWQERQIRLQAITEWNLSGILSVVSSRSREIVRFRWEQERNNYKIRLAGPLNFGSVRILGGDHGVDLWHTSKQPIHAKTPEQLVQQQLGWGLPVAHLRYWILGIPAPRSKIAYPSFDQYGHLVAFNQDGWQIKYLIFGYSLCYHVDLPQLITLHGHGISAKLSVKIR